MSTPANLVDRLASHRTLRGAPHEELTWIADRGVLRKFNRGDVLTAKGTRPKGLFLVLSGSFSMSVDRGAGARKIMEWREGDVMGLLPYSRVAGPPGDAVAQDVSEILELDGDHMRGLTKTCHDVTAILVHAMIDRARAFTSSDLHDEKMISLGKLSAGLAHELNNPAAAIERSAALLNDRLEDCERATRTLGTLQLGEAQLTLVESVRETCVARQELGVRSPIQQAEREEAIADWLAERDLDI